MSNGFDVYHQWLGIAPKDQPPHHYRLLGIDLFESDPNVIENAADQRMQHVRSFQNGPHGEASQRLLNEITSAKLCLLNAARKAEYDVSLKAEKEAAEAAARPSAPAVWNEPTAAKPGPLAPADTDLGPPMPRPPTIKPTYVPCAMPLSPKAGLPRPTAAKLPRGLTAQQAIIAGGALGVLVIVVIAVLIATRSQSPTAQDPVGSSDSSANTSSPNQVKTSPAEGVKTTFAGPVTKQPPEAKAEGILGNGNLAGNSAQTPPQPAAAKPTPAKVAPIFNGKDFEGWQFKGPGRGKWAIGKALLDPKNRAQFVTETASDAQDAELVNTAGAGGIGGDIYTTAKYGDCTIDLEFKVAKGTDSGVYVMGEYEVQIFDSHSKRRMELVDLGGVFAPLGRPPTDARPPRTNAAKAPGAWQKMVIEFQAPRFEGNRKTANARFLKITINGQVVQENVELFGPNVGGLTGSEPATGPLMLQGAHGPVAFRNIDITPH